MSTVDTRGVYENNVLKSTISDITDIRISSSCTSIYGTGPKDYAFMACKDTLQSFQFDPNPKITSIQSYAFSTCVKLQKIDLSMCLQLKVIGEYAFFHCKIADELKLPPAITEIGERCFYQCFKVPSLVIPDSLERISFGAFYQCSSLSTCTINDECCITDLPGRLFSSTALQTFYLTPKISSVDINVFESCNLLKTITVSQSNSWFSSQNGVLFDKNVTKLFAFPTLNCKNYVIPSTVRVIGSVSFANAAVETIDFGDKLEKIYDYVFQSSSLTSISLPDSVTYIGAQFAYHCKNLKSIKLSNSLTSLPDNGFAGTAITSIDIPEGVKTIGKLCFQDCLQLKTIKLPSSLESCGGGVFSGCTGINITFGDNSNLIVTDDLFLMNKKETEIMDYFGTEENITLKASIVHIKDSAFTGKTMFKNITFESDNTLTTIGSYAFNGCINLEEIVLPKSVLYVNMYAFYNCRKIKSVHFYPCIKTLEDYAFEYCSELKEVIFEPINAETSLTIKRNCFNSCPKLSKVTLSERIVAINDNVFSKCSELKTIDFPASLTLIGLDAFSLSGIETVTFPQDSKMINISDSAFFNAQHLKNIIIPENCNTLGSVAFANTAIETIRIPKNIKSIGTRCFSGCNLLKSFIVDEKDAQLQSLGDFLFEDCTNLSTIQCSNEFFVSENNVLLTENRLSLVSFPPASHINFFSVPQTIKTIGPNAFYRCLNLKSVQIQDESVETISISAFEGCKNLVLVNIPSCVRTVGANAFKDCSSLQCGLFIQKDETFISNLIETAKLPPKCLKPCSVLISCVCKANNFYLRFNLAILLLSLE